MTQPWDNFKGLAAEGHDILISSLCVCPGSKKSKTPAVQSLNWVLRLKTMTMLYCCTIDAKNNNSMHVSFPV